MKVVKLFGKQSGLGRGFMKKKYVKKVWKGIEDNKYKGKFEKE